MKKDLLLLAGVSFVLALALSFAAARNALPAREVWNPLAEWPARRCWIAIALLVSAFVASMLAIGASDRGLPRPSATLEWVYSSERATEIVSDYGDHRGQVMRGVLLDSAAFIPSYMLLFAVCAFFASRAAATPAHASLLVILGWSLFVAGACDYLENAGILLALGGVSTAQAPLMYAVCQIKWLLALTGAFSAAAARFIR